MSEHLDISVSGASVHNLKNLSCEIPRGQITVVCGLSGSGKSSLVFDTVGAEALYREKIFSGEVPKAAVESRAEIVGLPRTKVFRGSEYFSRRVTVGIETGIYPYLRELALHVGRSVCDKCGKELIAYTAPDIVRVLLENSPGKEIEVTSPLHEREPQDVTRKLEKLLSQGYSRVRFAGGLQQLEAFYEENREREAPLDEEVQILIDRFSIGENTQSRLREAIRLALQVSRFRVNVYFLDETPVRTLRFPLNPECPACHRQYKELSSGDFLFNQSSGACSSCKGRGIRRGKICSECKGTRLKHVARTRRLASLSLQEILSFSIDDVSSQWNELAQRLEHSETASRREAVRKCAEAISIRLRRLRELGLGYLQLSRGLNSLSSGERNRTRLVRALCYESHGTLFLLNEPLWGLHSLDQGRILAILRALVAEGNTVVQIEHEPQAIREADILFELGPGAGPAGGEIIFSGTPSGIQSMNTATAKALQSRISEEPKKQLKDTTKFITLEGVARNNLKNISARIPIGALTAVCGVSGSGKSSLILDVLAPAVRRFRSTRGKLSSEDYEALGLRSLSGALLVQRVLDLPQTTRRGARKGIAGAALGTLSQLRELFSQTVTARALGYEPSHFTLEATNINDIRYRGRTFHEMLACTISEARELFSRIFKISHPLERAEELGLGYLHLNEPLASLSFGELQRLKLSRLTARQSGALIILDEPTSGLHISERRIVGNVLRDLTERGNTVVVVEHTPEIIEAADYVIELGPGAGSAGGEIVHFL